VLPLLGLGLPIFLLGLGSPALYEPHESLSAEVAREMVVRGDWLTPHLNGTRYLDKPPLFYWLTAIAYSILACRSSLPVCPARWPGWAGCW
jgi:4-amino-4-deoxy-L-arabinose transferase-like glycosyltransferase